MDATLVRGGGGEFEVMVDGKLVFSKKQLGRFPDHDEVLGLLPDQAPPENAR